MSAIEGTKMWQVGKEVRSGRGGSQVDIDPYTAGIFCGATMAQIDVLLDRGHPYSEIANESVIEAVDSLIPYMHARGVAYMVDNCSTTARLGARKWAPRFEANLDQIAFPAIAERSEVPAELPASFRGHKIHQVLHQLAQMRPAVDIAVV